MELEKKGGHPHQSLIPADYLTPPLFCLSVLMRVISGESRAWLVTKLGWEGTGHPGEPSSGRIYPLCAMRCDQGVVGSRWERSWLGTVSS